MADYDPVTVADFTARFPIFAAAPPTQLAVLLVEAQRQVGTNWTAADFKAATLYLMAHLLVLDSSQIGDEVAVGPAGAGRIIASESISGMSVSYFNSTQGGSKSTSYSDYQSTEYGRRYAALAKLNFSGPVAI